MEKHLEAPLRMAITFLEGSGYRYAIIGGIAMLQWGIVRATRDVDIKILVPNLDYSALRTVLRAAFPEPARQTAPKNPLIVAVTIDNVIVDFLLALPGYEENIINRAIRGDMDGWSAWVCSAEDLIIQKVVAGRGKDWSDVEALLIEQWGKLDEAYIEGWLVQFAEALEQPQMLADYKNLLDEIRRLPDEA